MSEPCKRCLEIKSGKIELQILEEPPVRNSLSRVDNDTYICNLCGKAEGLADYLQMDFDLVRIAIEQDFQEARRLPPGTTWGTLYPFPTGGLHSSSEENEGHPGDPFLYGDS
jgi:hypothetical protein